MGKLISGIHHVSLRCDDYNQFEKVVSFYKDVLELEVSRCWGEGKSAGIMFECGNGLVEVFASGRQNSVTGNIEHFALVSKDVKAVVEKVRSAGYPVIQEAKDIVIPADKPMAATIAFVSGHLGEIIEIFDEK